MELVELVDESRSTWLQQMNQAASDNSLSSRTVRHYRYWITRYISFHDLQDPKTLNEKHIRHFIRFIIDDLNTSVATCNQALSALIFFYDKILETPLNRQSDILTSSSLARTLPLEG